jgi:cytochrome c biogenesis protein CcdA
MRKNIWHRIGGFLAAGLALVACPCHLIVTLPLLFSVTAGTAIGVFLEQNRYGVIAVSIIAFISGLILAFRWLGSSVSEDATRFPKQFQTLMNHLPRDGSLNQDK